MTLQVLGGGSNMDMMASLLFDKSFHHMHKIGSRVIENWSCQDFFSQLMFSSLFLMIAR